MRTALAPLEPGFYALPSWTLTPPEFAPYLLASGRLSSGQRIADQQRRVDQVMIALKADVAGEEDIVVSAGRFRATKVVLRGQTPARGGAVMAEHIVWYAPQVKRAVKYAVSTRVGNALRESTVFELMEFKLN